ncbi:MAG: hypothetical protein ACKOWF_06935, partial [Chloroflexota bacterium]
SFPAGKRARRGTGMAWRGNGESIGRAEKGARHGEAPAALAAGASVREEPARAGGLAATGNSGAATGETRRNWRSL